MFENMELTLKAPGWNLNHVTKGSASPSVAQRSPHRSPQCRQVYVLKRPLLQVINNYGLTATWEISGSWFIGGESLVQPYLLRHS